jgi:hypothetical protein
VAGVARLTIVIRGPSIAFYCLICQCANVLAAMTSCELVRHFGPLVFLFASMSVLAVAAR